MALTLRVTSFHSQALGALATKTFGLQGGTIGRKNDNDWVLPDPERFISGCHARIVCRNGAFAITDLSANGTFVNGSPQPVGNGAEQVLHDGDRLQIGEYEIAVSIDAGDMQSVTGPTGFDLGAGRGAQATGPSWPSQTGPAGSEPMAPPPPQATSPTGGDSFGGQGMGQPSAVDPLDFFSDRSAPQSPAAPAAESDHASTLDQFYQPPPVQPQPPAGGEPAGPAAIPEDWDMTGFSPATPPPPRPEPLDQSFAPQPPQPPPSPQVAPTIPMGGDGAAVVSGILQAAGLDAASAQAAASSPAVAQSIGTLLGVVVQGMLEVLKARSEIKSQFRVPVTMMRSVENNPLKFSATPAQALQTLLQQQNQAYMGPVEAFTEGFQDIKAHQMAMMAGMRAAFDSMIGRFDPAELIERFEKRVKRAALISLPGKGRYWDMYQDLYEEWSQDADLNFQRLFGDEFARAYEEQMSRLTRKQR